MNHHVHICSFGIHFGM